MKNMLASIIRNKIASCVVLLLLGVLLVIAPLDTLTRSVRIVGFVLLAGAVVGFLIYFLSKNTERSPLVLLESVFAAALAVFLIAAPALIAGVLPLIFGIVLLLNSLLDLVTALRLPRGKVIAVLLSMLSIVAAVVIICNPGALANIIVRVIGVSFIYSAVVGLLSLLLAGRTVKRLEP